MLDPETCSRDIRCGSARRSGTAQAQTEVRGRAEETRFRSMDADNDGVIIRGEWRGSDESFRQNDTNRDGVLSGAELAPARQAQVRGRQRDERVAQFARADRAGTTACATTSGRPISGSFEEAGPERGQGVTRASSCPRPEPGPRIRRQPRADQRPTFAGVHWRSTRGSKGDWSTGAQAGKENRTVNGGKWDLEGQRELEQADAGYEPRLGRREDYQAGFRAGFRRGYTAGFGPQ